MLFLYFGLNGTTKVCSLLELSKFHFSSVIIWSYCLKILIGLRFEPGLPLAITRLNATSHHLQLPKVFGSISSLTYSQDGPSASFLSAHQVVLAYNVGKNLIPILVHLEKVDDPCTTIESLIMTTLGLHISIITYLAPI